MEKRIKWKEGMEISPEVFIQNDKYHLSKISEVGKLLACERYGIVKGDISFEPIDGLVCISVKGCFALAANGTIVKMEGMKKLVPIDNDGYIIIRQNGLKVDEDEGISFEEPLYSCFITSNIEEGDIIIGRMNKCVVEKNYIPPCYMLGAHPELVKLYERCVNYLKSIRDKMKAKEFKGDTTLLELLAIELNNLGERESPKALYLVMIKIVFCLHKLYPTSRLPIIPPFNEMDIAESLIPLRDHLEQFFHWLDNIVEPVKVEPVEEKKVEKKYKFKI